MTTFTEKEINDIYINIVKKNQSYFNNVVQSCPVKMWNYDWSGKDAPRCLCICNFIEWTTKYNLNHVDILNLTSSDDPELEFITANKINIYSYLYNTPESVDLHHFKNQDKCDFFIFNQTIEHLYNPFLAIKNIYDNIKPGGYVFTSVPTLCIPHDTPFHFANWTPMGLAMLFMSAGFKIKETGQWGNRNYIINAFNNGHDFPDLNKCGSHNEETNVCGCWLLAQKMI